MPIDNNENKEFKPVIVAFCCNWCSYAGADLAGSSRLSYPADVKIIRVPCACRVNPLFILRAFQKGADGVILCGCHPGDCHYSTGNYYARRRMTLLFSMLDYMGVENGRTRVEWVSAAESVVGKLGKALGSLEECRLCTEISVTFSPAKNTDYGTVRQKLFCAGY